MAQIVAAMAMSHNPRMVGAPEAAPEQYAQVEKAFAELRSDLVDAAPDWMLLVTNEHLHNAFYPYLPPFTLGTARQFRSVAEPYNKLEERVVPSDQAVSDALLAEAWQAGFDLALSVDLRLDHGAMVPLKFLLPDLDVPVIPLLQLTARGPRSPLRRCWQFGGWLRQFIDGRPRSERVAVVGAGGLSHWVGNTRMGEVNVGWNHRVLDLLEQHRHDELVSMTDAEIEEAGNGAHELRHWVTTAGVVPDASVEVISHIEEVRPWAEGIVHVRFRLP